MLERVPFVSGYGVEFALLVDLHQLLGLDALAQCDLGRRGTTVRTSWPSAGWPARFSRHHPAPAVGHSSGVPGRLEMPCAISARR
ncbi:MAG: hypothetical protein ACR2JK_03615 [Geodermatophilaceae bacterium]